MKKKILTALGALFSLAIFFSACSDDKSSAPSAIGEEPGIITPDATSSSSTEDVPASSAIPQSGADAIPLSSADAVPQSSESQKSSSSFVPPWSNAYWSDGVYYNPGACCPDTVYIENGNVVRTHTRESGVCPPPSVVMISCEPPVQVDLDSTREAETRTNKKVPTITIYECLARTEVLLKKGVDSLKKALPVEGSDGSVQIEYWQDKYCGANANLSFERSGDTLSVNLAESQLSADCNLRCRSRINVPDSLQDFSYVSFEGYTYELW